MNVQELETRIQAVIQQFEAIRQDLATQSPEQRQQVMQAVDSALASFDVETREAVRRILQEVVS